MDILSAGNAYQKELFARGYVFKDTQPPTAPAHWSRARFSDFFLAYDPRLGLNIASEGSANLLCLGILCDVRKPMLSTPGCIEKYAKSLELSQATFLEEIDYTCGRYIMAYARGADAWLLTDATGMKSAYYYHAESRVISSHVRLVSANGAEAEAETPLAAKFGYPGIRAPVSNTFLLTPNTKLGLHNFSARRFWPRGPVKQTNIEEASRQVGVYLQGAMAHFAQYYKPLVSITAGLDSRTTLSTCRGLSNIEYFSYFRGNAIDTDQLDREFAEAFSDMAGGNVNIVMMSDWPGMDRNFKEMQDASTTYNHLKKMAWIYYCRYRNEEGILHVRSNVSEVGREFWRGKKFTVLTGKDLARVYLKGDEKYKSEYVFEVIERFEEFARINGLLQCGSQVDLKSLFYWEFRMASWHAGVVAESDPAFDTVSLYNCRKTLELMLGVSRRERATGRVLRSVIEGLWPELAQYKVNGKPFWSGAK